MVGTQIKKLRLMKGYSINELSERAGVSKSYLSYIERGIQKNPSLQILSKLAHTLDTNLEQLLDKNDAASSHTLDEEWMELLGSAIKEGVTKEDFRYCLEFLKFKRITDDLK
ncbi:helix-turn-helix domain-containing protein [Niallia sp. NCCP-28]|uniref:helix-turn-helix domain-containing protein n=1 Tax=Niallia sp. NCCP-28 TaxID=2934712 RepID=UPI00208CF634|nr:helix-turn-helix domain-containing protein [Niallia sp. NCCP-28]GKU84417.1 transcriptional regulator [Niallia sp. NCCP-28]